MAGLLDFLQGASNSAAANVSAPIDGLNWLLRKMGAPVSEKPFLGSDWMADKGLTAVPQNRNMGLLGEAVGGVLPMVAAAKAPQIAQGLLQAERNLAAPRTLNPQTGAILWHGSPHKFDAFDASKIGTGEGAQAYGHGLYLADSDEVAKQYQKSILPAIKVLDSNGESIVSDSAKSANAMHQLMRYKDINKAKQQTIDKDTLAELLKLEKRGAVVKGGGAGDGGSLYKVDLPDDQIAKMLDWDKPLSEQQHVIDALKNTDILKKTAKEGGWYGDWLKNANGSALIRNGGSKESDALRQAGIPGIRYLDGGSRGTGAGTSNYVVFPGNEGLLSILERNGQPIK